MFSSGGSATKGGAVAVPFAVEGRVMLSTGAKA
jgi:hypothetical protein